MNSLTKLMQACQKGNVPIFMTGPFLSVESLWAKGLNFNQVLQSAQGMAQVALMNLELGFEATVVPFDMNVEAETIGCPVNYHDEAEGVPVYPTVGERWIETAEDFDLPANVDQAGRIPLITSAIRQIKDQAAAQSAVGAFLPGPFTLAGQVMDPDQMLVNVLKKPQIMGAVLDKLTELLIRVRAAYTQAGVDYIIIEEGGATSISPKSFKNLVLPALKRLLEHKSVPHILSLAGRSEGYLHLLAETGADGIGVDQKCDPVQAMQNLPQGFPLFATCGSYDMLAKASPEQIQDAVHACLEQGITMACPPADIYPPARRENITAFIMAHKFYRSRGG